MACLFSPFTFLLKSALIQSTFPHLRIGNKKPCHNVFSICGKVLKYVFKHISVTDLSHAIKHLRISGMCLNMF